MAAENVYVAQPNNTLITMPENIITDLSKFEPLNEKNFKCW